MRSVSIAILSFEKYSDSMVYMRKRVIGLIIVMTSLCLSFCSISKVSASSDALLNTLYIDGYSSIDTKNPRVLHMIQGFCTSVLSAGPVSYDGVKYDARYSAFVYLLCKNI